MSTSDTLIADAFRRVYGQMIDDTPPAPAWEKLNTIRVRAESARTGPRAWVVALAAAVVVLVAVGGVAWLTRTDTPTPVAPTTTTTLATSTTTTTTSTTTTTVAPVATPVESSDDVDGFWRLVSGTLDGTQFADETTGGFLIDIAFNALNYAIDCNGATSQLRIDHGSFVLGLPGHSDVYCTGTEASGMFYEALPRVDHIASQPPYLVLSGDGAELIFTRPETPEVLGGLGIATAGQLLSFEVADGRQRTNQYLLVHTPEDLGTTALYLLTTQTGEGHARWQRWHAAAGALFGVPAEELTPVDPAVAATGPGPDTVLIPDRLDGVYALCSPFWEPDPFCYTLTVQQSFIPRVASAGPNGVVIHGIHHDSEVLSTEPTTVAFYVDGRLVAQTTDQPDWIQVDGTQIPLQPGEALLDVAVVDDRTLALVTGSGGSATIDLDRGNRVAVGPQALAGRFGSAVVVLRTASDTIEARDLNGEKLWERTIDPNAMVNPDVDGLIHVDTFRNLLSAGPGIPAPYYQYIATELLDTRSGQTIDSYEEQVQMPNEGHNIDEPCGRTELREGVLLCPQPDGQTLILNSTATYDASTVTYVRFRYRCTTQECTAPELAD